MANPFGGFVHRSPLSSLLHDPVVSLASNCIRDYFGPTVQTVFDCLEIRGGSSSTLAQIVSRIRSQCRRDWNEERERLVVRQAEGRHQQQYKLHRARGPPAAGFVVEVAPIRAALLVLIQHGIVHVHHHHHHHLKSSSSNNNKHSMTTSYRLDTRRARLLPRYPRYVEFAKKALDEVAAALVEELLIHGQMRTVDAVVATVNSLQELGENAVKSSRYTQRQAVVESFRRLVAGGFIEKVPLIDPDEEEEEDEEAEFDDATKERPRKKQKTQNTASHQAVQSSSTTPRSSDSISGEDPTVVALLKSAPYKNVLPRDAIWRVNIPLFNDSLRAFCMGRLVAERYGHRVQSAGSMVTAALKLAAHRRYAAGITDFEQIHVFTPKDIINYLPKPVQQALESKPGGIHLNLSRSLHEMSQLTYPPVVHEVEESVGHPDGGKFEIATMRLVEHLRHRIHHQVVLDSNGEVAARICSILDARGYLEADAVAEMAMVPAKDTREILHRLYRENFIGLFTLQQSKQHNPSSTIYLWNVKRDRMARTVTDNVCTALLNLRLRRQHEMESGKDWIERAKEGGVTDGHQETDKANYQRFCQGLERLDNAMLQLDETLMVLLDF